jgi:uncharacterized paraquat-inducible protein A
MRSDTVSRNPTCQIRIQYATFANVAVQHVWAVTPSSINKYRLWTALDYQDPNVASSADKNAHICHR